MKAALLCTVLATGEMSCKRPEEILPTEKSTDLIRKVDVEQNTKQKNIFSIYEIQNIQIPQDTLKSVKEFNPRQPWVGIWKFTEDFRLDIKQFLIISPTNRMSLDKNNIVGSKIYWCAWSDDRQVYDMLPLTFVSGDILYTTNDKKTYTFSLNGYAKGNTYQDYFEISFKDKDSLDITNWGSGKAVRVDKLPYP